MTGALHVEASISWEVLTHRLQDVIAEYLESFKKIFGKVDIEGGEYDTLPIVEEILANKSVSALISFHHRRLKRALEHKHGS
jgi:hypothetical protein